MIQTAFIIGTGLIATGLIGAGVGIGVVFGEVILGVAKNPSLRGQLFSRSILGFALEKATGLFALMITFLLDKLTVILKWLNTEIPAPQGCTVAIRSCDNCIMAIVDAIVQISNIENLAYIYEQMGNSLLSLARNFSAITTGQILQYCSSNIPFNQVYYVMVSLYATTVSSAGSLDCEAFQAFLRTSSTVVAIYMPGQGILAPWLTDVLTPIGLPWSNELLQNLTNFVR